ncbi:type IV pilus biogenesis protein PilM [Marinilactibacillus piezotolerans]|uniref:type IV pilus biogenesis protein PilM n=1 Tax=Marinilactibacillus piezotolerans TaxID=258723 RepID=UPI0009B10267|nr:pilus assembly protein PilM [Marinilactibacillus piezotolerans]
MLFNTKPELFIQFRDNSILYMIYDRQKNQVLEQEQLVLDLPVLIEGRLTNETLVQKRLELLIQEKKLKKAKTYFILPDYFTMIRKEKIPIQLDETEIKAYLDLHINGSIRLPFDSPKVDFQVIDRSEEHQTILLTAYPKDQIAAFQKLLEDAQLQPVVADFSYLSVYRTFKTLQAEYLSPDKHTLMIQWHPFDSSMTVFHKDVPQFNRHTNFPRVAQSWEQSKAGQWKWTGTEQELSIVLEDQINAIERFLDFYKYSVMNGETMVTQILLSGSYPDLETLYQKLAERIDLAIVQLILPEQTAQTFAPLYGLQSKEPKAKPKKISKRKQQSVKAEKQPVEEASTVHD